MPLSALYHKKLTSVINIMKYFFVCLSIIININFSGCTNYIEKTSEPMSQAAYGIFDSIKVGRFDKAQDYSNDLIKLVPPPKTRLEIKPIYKK